MAGPNNARLSASLSLVRPTCDMFSQERRKSFGAVVELAATVTNFIQVQGNRRLCKELQAIRSCFRTVFPGEGNAHVTLLSTVPSRFVSATRGRERHGSVSLRSRTRSKPHPTELVCDPKATLDPVLTRASPWSSGWLSR